MSLALPLNLSCLCRPRTEMAYTCGSRTGRSDSGTSIRVNRRSASRSKLFRALITLSNMRCLQLGSMILVSGESLFRSLASAPRVSLIGLARNSFRLSAGPCSDDFDSYTSASDRTKWNGTAQHRPRADHLESDMVNSANAPRTSLWSELSLPLTAVPPFACSSCSPSASLPPSGRFVQSRCRLLIWLAPEQIKVSTLPPSSSLPRV